MYGLRSNYLLTNRGGALLEFIFCSPVIFFLMYGLIYINSYFDKQQRMTILVRSQGFSQSQQQSDEILKKDIEFKRESHLDESLLFEDRVKYGLDEGVYNLLSVSNLTTVQDVGIGRIGVEYVKNQKDRRINTTLIASTRKDDDSYTVEDMASRHVDYSFASNAVLNNRIFSSLDSGFLDEKSYDKLSAFYYVMGTASSWGSQYIDECLMKFSPYTSCNGTNVVWIKIATISAGKTVGEIFSLGVGTVISMGASIIVDGMVDKVFDSAIGKAREYFEELVRQEVEKAITPKDMEW